MDARKGVVDVCSVEASGLLSSMRDLRLVRVFCCAGFCLRFLDSLRGALPSANEVSREGGRRCAYWKSTKSILEARCPLKNMDWSTLWSTAIRLWSRRYRFYLHSTSTIQSRIFQQSARAVAP